MLHALSVSRTRDAILPSTLPPSEAQALTVSVVRTRSGFDSLEDKWNDLFARCASGRHVFQSFNWNWHWANAYLAADAELAVMAMYRADKLVALWPLVLARLPALRLIEWMGAPVSQYGDVLIDPAEDQALILQRGWDVIGQDLRVDALHLRKVRADANVRPLLQGHQATEMLANDAPYLDIASAPDFATYETRYSAKARKNRHRLARRLAEMGEVVIEHLSDDAEAARAAHEAVALRRQTLAETGRVSPALREPRYAAFFAQAASGAKPCGCRVTRFRVGGRLAASAIDVTAHGHRAAHIIAHDPAFDACGPGMLMVEDWVRTACADGIATLDLLAPAHGYKWDWADGSVGVCDYVLPVSAKGRLLAEPYLARVRPRIKEAVEKFAAWRAGDKARSASADSD